MIFCCVAISIIFMKYITDIWNEIVTWCHNGVEPEPEPQIETIKYGALYNWYAATDPRNICPAGWRIPSNDDFVSFITSLGGYDQAGKIKETGTTHWNSPNTNATNAVSFSARGAGYRDCNNGDFYDLMDWFGMWSTTDDPDPEYPEDAMYQHAQYNLGTFVTEGLNWENKKNGVSLRPCRDATEAELLLPDGTQCDDYVGNDLQTYETRKIGSLVWTIYNLAETKYRDGSDIAIVTDNSAWAALTTGAMCYYDNDINNV